MTGRSSGYQACNLAFHLGVKRILLLGFDMRAVNGRTHWHEQHQRPTSPKDYATHMAPPFKRLAEELGARGVEVVNCTPGSAITAFPVMPIEQALAAERTLETCLAPGA